MTRRIGRVEAADGGTLFLDEISDLTMQTQAKLRRFLPEQAFLSVVSNEERPSDLCFLAATCHGLKTKKTAGFPAVVRSN